MQVDTSKQNPSLRPVGFGEALHQITGKVGAEAAINTIYNIYSDEPSEAVLLADAEND